MLKKFFIFLQLFSALSLASQAVEFNLTVPEFIPYNTRFEVSLVCSSIPEADSLAILIKTSDRLQLNGVNLRSGDNDILLEFREESPGTYIYKLEADLKEFHHLPGDMVQLILQLKPESILSGQLTVNGIFFNNGEEQGKIENEAGIPSAEMTFYKPNKTAGRCLELKTGESFIIENVHKDFKQLIAECWIKFNSPEGKFLEITNGSGGKFEARLGKSQALLIESDLNPVDVYPVFLSGKTWNHLAVVFIPAEERIVFYCSDILTASYKIDAKAKLMFSFNNSMASSIYIDLFRFISSDGADPVRFRDRNYLTYISDGSTLLEQITFDDQPGLRNYGNGISLPSSSLVKSDAPIFQRAPELNVNILSSSLVLEWTGGDYQQADHYIIEKSSGSSYETIGNITPENHHEKNYSYIDPRNERDGILYYRIKQINKDGSFVYSPEIKIGQGFIEPFTIEQNFPNPFNPKTSIEIEFLVDTEVDIVVYNLEGKEVERLYKGTVSKGVHKFSFNAEGLPSGIYLYKISTPEYSQTRKMILAK